MTEPTTDTVDPTEPAPRRSSVERQSNDKITLTLTANRSIVELAVNRGTAIPLTADELDDLQGELSALGVHIR